MTYYRLVQKLVPSGATHHHPHLLTEEALPEDASFLWYDVVFHPQDREPRRR
jgi:hypothetical protein